MPDAPVLDTIASRVTGFLSAKDCRIVWIDGRLYICKSPSDIAVYEATKPVKSAGSYKVMIGDKALRFLLPSCGSCRQRVMKSPVGQMTVDQIVAAAASEQLSLDA